MKISISNHVTDNFTPVEVTSREELIKLTSSNYWSSGVYKDGYRNLKNFLYADFIALDIDNGCTIEKAKEVFSEYKHIILPSQNHRKIKKGVLADRFRVILQLEKRITDVREYKATWKELFKKFPFLDNACSDASRFWNPSSGEAYSSHWKSGKMVKVVKPKNDILLKPTLSDLKGNLNRKTYDFLLNGKKDNWNHALYEAALDFRSQGYSQEEAEFYLKIASREELGNDGELDNNDLKTINSAYMAESVGHEKRGSAGVFNIKSIGQLMNSSGELDWIVDDFMVRGGLSLWAGAPKAGKSTIIRQLCKCIVRGETFLGRECKKGKVLYLALEEQEQLLAKQLTQLGLTDEDSEDFKIHVGPVISQNKIEALGELIGALETDFVVIDTLILFAGIKDINSYNEVYGHISNFRDLARKNNVHIMFVHHQNKGPNDKSYIPGTNSIMGSQALHGSVDAAIIFSNMGGTRFITSSQRGGTPFNNRSLEFDADKQSYFLGRIDI